MRLIHQLARTLSRRTTRSSIQLFKPTTASILRSNFTPRNQPMATLTSLTANAIAQGHIVTSASRAESLAESDNLGITLSFNVQDTSNVVPSAYDTLVIFKTKEQFAEKNLSIQLDGVDTSCLVPSSSQIADFKAEANTTLIHYPSSSSSFQRVVYVCVGPVPWSTNITVHAVRSATHAVINTLKQLRAVNVAVVPIDSPVNNNENDGKAELSQVIDSITRTAVSSNHVFDRYLTGKRKDADTENGDKNDLSSPASPARRHRISSITYLTSSSSSALSSSIQVSSIISECTLLHRELGNDRADNINPLFMEVISRRIAAKHGLTFKCLQDEDLRAENLHLLASVGQAARHKARLVILSYEGDKSTTEKIALVGKGITFDTGGLNLKGTGNMEEMHLDMCGSAAVLSSMKAIGILKPKINVVGVLALAENAIDSNSYYPHQIIASSAGSVEISNTDAEGRLALADALVYTQQHYQPHTIIDIATLTGACVVALGEHLAGLYSTNEELAQQLLQSGLRTSDRCWRMPLLPEYASELKTTFADFKSSGSRMGGSCVAASFLHKFIQPKTKWSHLDVAGPAMFSKARDIYPEGSTGFGTQLFIDYILQQAKNNETNAKN